MTARPSSAPAPLGPPGYICPCGVRKLPCQYPQCDEGWRMQLYQEAWGVALSSEKELKSINMVEKKKLEHLRNTLRQNRRKK